AKRHIGGTGRRAEAAMDAAAEDLFRLRHLRIGELFGGEIRLQLYTPAILPGLNIPSGSSFCLIRADRAATASISRSNAGRAALACSGARTSVACPPPSAR